MKKLKIAAAAAIATLAVALALVMTVEFDAPGLGKRILDAAGESAGIELQAAGFRFNVRRGIILEHVVARTPIASGTVVATVDRVVLEHRLWPLLRGDIEVARLLLESPVIEVIQDAVGTTAAAAGEGAGHADGGAGVTVRRRPTAARVLPVSLAQHETAGPSAPRAAAPAVTVHAASVTNGTLLLSSAGNEPTTRVYGLDVELRDMVVDAAAPSAAVGLTARGHVDVGEVQYRDRRARGNRALLSADGGVYTVTDLVLTTPEGRITLQQLVADLAPDPYTYRLALSGSDIDLNLLLDDAPAAALGAAGVELDASGSGPGTGEVVGRGRVHLAAGRIPDLPALRQIAELIGLQLAGLPYEATDIDFTLGNDRVDVSPFAVVSELLRLEAAGRIDVDGALAARARVAVPREHIELGAWQGDFTAGLVDALTDDRGWVSIPLLVDGTVAEPRVRPDAEQLLAALQQRTGGSLGDWLRGLIKRER